MIETVLVAVGVAAPALCGTYLWTREFDERIARLEKRDFERTEAEMRASEEAQRSEKREEEWRRRMGALVARKEEATERLHRTGEGVE